MLCAGRMGELLRQHIDDLCNADPRYRSSLNVIIKYEIQCLLERLSKTGEEAVVITTSVDPSCPGYLGSLKGEQFIQDNDTLALLHTQLIDFCKGASATADSDDSPPSLPGETSDMPEQDDGMPVLRRESDTSPSHNQPHSSSSFQQNSMLNETSLISDIPHSTSSTALSSGTDSTGPTIMTSHTQKRKAENELSPKVIKLQKLVEIQRTRKSVEKMIKKEPMSPIDPTPKSSATHSDMKGIHPNNNSSIQDYVPVFPKAKVLKLLGPASSKLRAQHAAQQALQSKPEQRPLTPLCTIKDFNSITKSAESTSNIAVKTPIRIVSVSQTDVNANKKITPLTTKIPVVSSQASSPVIHLQCAKSSPVVQGKSLVLTITTCYICRQEFASYVLLKEHMKEHSEQDKQEAEGNDAPEAKIACGLCGVECLKKDMSKHFKTHGINEDEAPNAEKSADGAEETAMEDSINVAGMSHLEDMDEDSNEVEEGEDCGDSAGNINCGICKTQCSKDQLFEHMERHNQKADRLNIEEMYVEGTSEEEMKDQQGHTVFKKMYRCLKCSYVSDRPSRMKEHCRTCYFSDPLYGCKYCGRAYRMKRNLIRHLKSAHLENDDWSMNPNVGSSKRFVCEKCYYETTKMSRYKEHLQICGVTNEKFECILCEKVFKIKRYLNKHIKTHMVGKKFYCNVCRFNTDTIEGMKKHKDEHQANETVDVLKPEFCVRLEQKIKTDSLDTTESENTTEYKESQEDNTCESEDTTADNDASEIEDATEHEDETEGED